MTDRYEVEVFDPATGHRWVKTFPHLPDWQSARERMCDYVTGLHPSLMVEASVVNETRLEWVDMLRRQEGGMDDAGHGRLQTAGPLRLRGFGEDLSGA